jgi:hypothetical protein
MVQRLVECGKQATLRGTLHTFMRRWQEQEQEQEQRQERVRVLVRQ